MIKAGYKCSAVATVSDKPTGRKQILTPSPVKLYAQKNNIPVLSVSRLNNLHFTTNKRGDASRGAPTRAQDFTPSTWWGWRAAGPRPTFAVVADFGLLIPPELIKIFPKGILNLHPSLLPAYQGATPCPFQILRGEKEGGITIIAINEKFDEGKIVAQEKFPILDYETTETLLIKGFTIGAKLLIKILPDYLDGKLKPIPQNLSKKSYFPRLSRDDGFISWNTLKKAMKGEFIAGEERPTFMKIAKLYIVHSKLYIAQYIEHAIRALSPWPGVWTTVDIKGTSKRLKLLKSHVEGNKLVLDLVQLEGKNPVSFSQFQKAYWNDII